MRDAGVSVKFDVDTETATVVLIDDHPSLGEALGPFIKAKGSGLTLLGSATTGEGGIAMVDDLVPNVVLVDLGLPGIDGWEVCSRIRAQHPDTGIVIYTAYESDENVLRAQAAGVSAYIGKREKGRLVIRQLRSAAEYPHSFWAANLGDVYKRAQERDPEDDVTPTEVEWLKRLAQGKTMKEIGAELDVADTTMRIYMSRVYAKLGAKNAANATNIARDRGLFDRARDR